MFEEFGVHAVDRQKLFDGGFFKAHNFKRLTQTMLDSLKVSIGGALTALLDVIPNIDARRGWLEEEAIRRENVRVREEQEEDAARLREEEAIRARLGEEEATGARQREDEARAARQREDEATGRAARQREDEARAARQREDEARAARQREDEARAVWQREDEARARLREEAAAKEGILATLNSADYLGFAYVSSALITHAKCADVCKAACDLLSRDAKLLNECISANGAPLILACVSNHALSRSVVGPALRVLCKISWTSADLDALLTTSTVPPLIACLQTLPARGPASFLKGCDDIGNILRCMYQLFKIICGHSDSLRRHCLELGVYPLLHRRLRDMDLEDGFTFSRYYLDKDLRRFVIHEEEYR